MEDLIRRWRVKGRKRSGDVKELIVNFFNIPGSLFRWIHCHTISVSAPWWPLSGLCHLPELLHFMVFSLVIYFSDHSLLLPSPPASLRTVSAPPGPSAPTWLPFLLSPACCCSLAHQHAHSPVYGSVSTRRCPNAGHVIIPLIPFTTPGCQACWKSYCLPAQ